MLVTVENGVATDIKGDPSMPFTDGTLCTKVAHYLERTYAAERLLYPQRRVGKKGEGRFARISWNEALDEIAARLKRLAAEDPQTILPCSYAGTMGMVQYMSMDRRFFHKLGASLLDRTLCSSAGKFGIKATLGGSVGMDPERFDEAELIILWGEPHRVEPAPLVACAGGEATRRESRDHRPVSQPVGGEVHAAHRATSRHRWRARPGMMHVLITEGLIDRDYVERYTLGYEPLKKRVLEHYPPDWAARTCGISTDEVIELAREYGRTKPAAIRLNYGMQRHAGGGIAARTIACLPALTGAWRDPAGGIVLTTADFYRFDHAALERPDLLAGRRPRVINHSQLGDALTSAEPPVRMTIVYNNNPVAVSGLGQGHRRLLARGPVHRGDGSFPDRHGRLRGHRPPRRRSSSTTTCTSRTGTCTCWRTIRRLRRSGSAPNSEVFRRLAARLGFEEPCFRDSDEDLCRTALNGVSWEGLKRDGWRKLDVPERFAPFAHGGFPTPSGKCEFHSAWLEQQGIDPLPSTTRPPKTPQSTRSVSSRRRRAIS